MVESSVEEVANVGPNYFPLKIIDPGAGVGVVSLYTPPVNYVARIWLLSYDITLANALGQRVLRYEILDDASTHFSWIVPDNASLTTSPGATPSHLTFTQTHIAGQSTASSYTPSDATSWYYVDSSWELVLPALYTLRINASGWNVSDTFNNIHMLIELARVVLTRERPIVAPVPYLLHTAEELVP